MESKIQWNLDLNELLGITDNIFQCMEQNLDLTNLDLTN